MPLRTLGYSTCKKAEYYSSTTLRHQLDHIHIYAQFAFWNTKCLSAYFVQKPFGQTTDNFCLSSWTPTQLQYKKTKNKDLTPSSSTTQVNTTNYWKKKTRKLTTENKWWFNGKNAIYYIKQKNKTKNKVGIADLFRSSVKRLFNQSSLFMFSVFCLLHNC